MDICFKELLKKVPKDKTRKVCKNCWELGHGITSVNCPENIRKQKILFNKVKKYVMATDVFSNKNIDEHIQELAEILKITPNHCKTLYNEISPLELLERPMDINLYIEQIKNLNTSCDDCGRCLTNIHAYTNRVWKGKVLCDGCWGKYAGERDELWGKVRKYKPLICVICELQKEYESQRFHYDHLNMFDKEYSICSMINECMDIDLIYTEVDKCQILCLPCHHKVTDIEHRLGFTRIKQGLTKQFNAGEITEEQYNEEKQKYNKIYKEKMMDIYEQLKTKK